MGLQLQANCRRLGLSRGACEACAGADPAILLLPLLLALALVLMPQLHLQCKPFVSNVARQSLSAHSAATSDSDIFALRPANRPARAEPVVQPEHHDDPVLIRKRRRLGATIMTRVLTAGAPCNAMPHHRTPLPRMDTGAPRLLTHLVSLLLFI